MAYNHTAILEYIARTDLIGHTDENKRFFRASGLTEIEELLQNVVRAEQGLIAEDSGDFSKDLNNVNARYQSNYYSFTVFQKYNSGDINSWEAAKNWTKETANKITDLLDYYCRQHLHGIKPLSITKFHFTTIGRLFDFWAIQVNYPVTETYGYPKPENKYL